MSTQRTTFKRETLLKQLSIVVAKLPFLDLPATIKAVYAFGGVLREKKQLHDIDMICLYNQTEEQSRRWRQFQENFSTVSLQNNNNRRPIHELWPLFETYYGNRLPLARVIGSRELSEALAAKGVEPKWVGCFSWTDIVNNPTGLFFPYIEKVLHKLLLRGVKGLSFIFLEYDQFMQGKSGYSQMNTVLAWSPEKPDIKANLFDRPSEEKREYARKELEKFLKIISEFKNRYMELKSELDKRILKLDFDALESSHSGIPSDAEATYSELLNNCEQARNEMRKYQEEIRVLDTIKAALARLMGDKEWPNLENPIEELVAWLTLSWQPKYEVKEKRIRELLRVLGLPESKVVAIKSPGSRTDYELLSLK